MLYFCFAWLWIVNFLSFYAIHIFKCTLQKVKHQLKIKPKHTHTHTLPNFVIIFQKTEYAYFILYSFLFIWLWNHVWYALNFHCLYLELFVTTTTTMVFAFISACIGGACLRSLCIITKYMWKDKVSLHWLIFVFGFYQQF